MATMQALRSHRSHARLCHVLDHKTVSNGEAERVLVASIVAQAMTGISLQNRKLAAVRDREYSAIVGEFREDDV